MRLSTALILTAIGIVNAEEEACSEPVAAKSHALLQKGAPKVSTFSVMKQESQRKGPEAGTSSTVKLQSEKTTSEIGLSPTIKLESEKKTPGRLSTMTLEEMKVNPSGAAAPLDESGYGAVSDRCCQAEMKEFIKRVVIENNLQICHEGGLEGITPYHSCRPGSGGTFAKLTADLLSDSQSECAWVQSSGGDCLPIPDPPTCPIFPEVPPASPCHCSRAAAAKVDIAGASLSRSNLGGQGPDFGQAEELHFSGSPGITSTGEPFDLVVTMIGDYDDGGMAQKNGQFTKNTELGVFFVRGEATFKFSFVKPGTRTPVTVPEIHMAIFDLDGGTAGYTGTIEHASSRGYAGYVTVPEPNLSADNLPDGRTQFTGTSNMRNPIVDMNAMTDEQANGSVMFFYRDVDSFELTFGRNRPCSDGFCSGLLFAFESSLDEYCDD